MDMSGTTTNDTAYTGAVCMSITVVGNTTNLPLSDPFCNTDKCIAFKAAHQASQAAISYDYQYHYGHFTTWFYLAVIGVAMAVNALALYQNSRPPKSSTALKSPSTLLHKLLALVRSVTYRSVGGVTASRFGLPGLGMLVFLLFSWILFLAMTFWAHPYYRERRGYGSPPLGVRTGLMSTALTPIIVALSGKVNIVTWLTGISHEKLNIMHRWASYLCLFLAVVHTVPFLVIAVQKCGSDGLRAQFYKPGGLEYSGVPPLGMLVGLCTLSVPWIRHRFYNLFYRIHVPMYITYLGLMFWHATNEGDSWAYLWATLAVWLFSVAVRLFHKWQTFNVKRSWFSGLPATIKELPGDMTLVTLIMPCDFRWKAGQHCFFRMPHLSPLQNHPYTIANLPSDRKGVDDAHQLSLYVRAHGGLTRDLLRSVDQHADRMLSMHLDGPYGGLVEDLPALYQSLIFVAGGSGISACLPHILNASRRIKGGKPSMVNRIRLVWMVRHPNHTFWVLDQLKEVHAALDSDMLDLDFYVTDTTLPQEKGSSRVHLDTSELIGTPLDKELGDDPEKEHVQATATLPTILDVATIHNRRPYLPDLLPSIISERRICVFGCGPQSLLLDLGNAVAQMQAKVLKGEADVVALHTEKFGW